MSLEPDRQGRQQIEQQTECVKAAAAKAHGGFASSSPRSCIYEGTVLHQRTETVEHAFRRSIYMLFLDLAELPQILDGGRFCSAERRAFARFRRSDHLGDPAAPLDESVRALVEQETGSRPQGPIAVLTQLRYLGIGFNPISVYYCYSADARRVDTIVAEVRNTPWLEMHCYVLPLTQEREPRSRGTHRLANPKTFHVSPFMEMDYVYRWRINDPGENLMVHIESWRNEQRCFQAMFRGRRRPLTIPTLARQAMRHPLVSAQVIGGIYFEALRLWRKGAPFFSHPTSESDRPEPSVERVS